MLPLGPNKRLLAWLAILVWSQLAGRLEANRLNEQLSEQLERLVSSDDKQQNLAAGELLLGSLASSTGSAPADLASGLRELLRLADLTDSNRCHEEPSELLAELAAEFDFDPMRPSSRLDRLIKREADLHLAQCSGRLLELFVALLAERADLFQAVYQIPLLHYGSRRQPEANLLYWADLSPAMLRDNMNVNRLLGFTVHQPASRLVFGPDAGAQEPQALAQCKRLIGRTLGEPCKRFAEATRQVLAPAASQLGLWDPSRYPLAEMFTLHEFAAHYKMCKLLQGGRTVAKICRRIRDTCRREKCRPE